MFPTKIFEKKRILVGITGCIAAYKTCELIRYLVTQGAQVRVMMTASAEKFITPLTLETLSSNPVYSSMFPEGRFTATHHIKLADWAELAILAPATASIIGKISHGIGDDFLSTTWMALQCPRVIAPAMNSKMWLNPIVQKNVQALKEVGHFLCPPGEGFLAEGYFGVGRLARLEYIVQYLYRAAHPETQSLKDKKVLITAGRTEEPLDPVRILTNRSTGKMGFALAWEAFARGAEVILVHGPGGLTPPLDITQIAVTTASEMYEAVKKYFPGTDILLGAAAVADFQPEQYQSEKIKKKERGFQLSLTRTVDILEEISKIKKPSQKLVGFAMETEAPEKNALEKLRLKNLDLIVLNRINETGAGFATDTNHVTLFYGQNLRKDLTLMYKLDVARHIFNFLLHSEKA